MKVTRSVQGCSDLVKEISSSVLASSDLGRRHTREAILRRLIMAPALLACFVMAGPAEAKVEHKSVTKSKADIQSYWTAERMQAAKPADQRFGGAAQAQAKKALPWTS